MNLEAYLLELFSKHHISHSPILTSRQCLKISCVALTKRDMKFRALLVLKKLFQLKIENKILQLKIRIRDLHNELLTPNNLETVDDSTGLNRIYLLTGPQYLYIRLLTHFRVTSFSTDFPLQNVWPK